MLETKTLLIIILLILLGSLVLCSCQSVKEKYTGMMDNSGLSSIIYSPTRFHSNLDPNNPSVQSDPYAYGGFIRGSEATSADHLAFDNSSSNVRFANSMNVIDPNASFKKEGFGYQIGQYSTSLDMEDKSISNDFSSIVQKPSTFKKTTMEEAPKTLEYTTPTELLPAPDMRQPLSRDPSDPSNFMYDRTLFAPLKSRNRNTPDRFRGDLDIKPIKTGWFDISTVPSVDLARGYFSSSKDITEHHDLEDVSMS